MCLRFCSIALLSEERKLRGFAFDESYGLEFHWMGGVAVCRKISELSWCVAFPDWMLWIRPCMPICLINFSILFDFKVKFFSISVVLELKTL
jgi:hypothetical protein